MVGDSETIKVGPFVFWITQFVSAEEAEGIREEIIRQMNEGVALLPNYIELVYHPGMSEPRSGNEVN